MAPASTIPALLCIWHDVETGFVEDYLRWHTFEHLPERLALPGFVSAERFEVIAGPGQRFSCFIDVDSLGALQSPAYHARLDAPTAWTRRLMPRYGRVHRALCAKRWEIGAGNSHLLACQRIRSAGDPSLAAELEEACSAWQVEGRVPRARLAELDPDTTGRDSEEKRLRRSEDAGGYDLVLLVDILSDDSLGAVTTGLEERMKARNATYELSTYRLSCLMRKDALEAVRPAS